MRKVGKFARLLPVKNIAELPPGWEMRLPGYAVDNGQTKAERSRDYYVRRCDARGGHLKTWAEDGNGVPEQVVVACIAVAADYPSEFAV